MFISNNRVIVLAAETIRLLFGWLLIVLSLVGAKKNEFVKPGNCCCRSDTPKQQFFNTDDRVTNYLSGKKNENLKMSGSLRAVRELSRKISCRGKLFIVNFTFGETPVLSK